MRLRNFVKVITALFIFFTLTFSANSQFSADKVIQSTFNDVVIKAGGKVRFDDSNVHIEEERELRFEDAAGGDYVSLKAPNSLAGNLTFTLPGLDGSSGECLTTNGLGVLSFSSCSDFIASNDNRLVRTDTVSGNELQESGITIDDNDEVTGVTKITVASTTEGSRPYPSMTQAQRDLIGSPAAGDTIYNSDTDQLNIYDGSAWQLVAGGFTATNNNRLLRSDTVGAETIQESGITVSDTDQVSGISKLDVSSTTESSRPYPSMTEAQRDAIASPVAGDLVYNTTSNKLNIYDGTSWGLPSGTTGTQVKTSRASGVFGGSVLPGTGATTYYGFPTTDFDPDGNLNNSIVDGWTATRSNATLYTVPETGTYHIIYKNCSNLTSLVDSNTMSVFYDINGTTQEFKRMTYEGGGGTSHQFDIQLSVVKNLTAGDTLAFAANQDSGANGSNCSGSQVFVSVTKLDQEVTVDLSGVTNVPVYNNAGSIGTFVFKADSSGNVIEPGSQDEVNGNCTESPTGVYSCSMNTTRSYFSCQLTNIESGAGTNICKLGNFSLASQSSLFVRCINSTTGAGVSESWSVDCKY